MKTLSAQKLKNNEPAEWIVLLGLLGFAGSTIAREAGVPLWKVWQILGHENISLKAYRRGESPAAEYIISRTWQARKMPVKLCLNKLMLPS